MNTCNDKIKREYGKNGQHLFNERLTTSADFSGLRAVYAVQ